MEIYLPAKNDIFKLVVEGIIWNNLTFERRLPKHDRKSTRYIKVIHFIMLQLGISAHEKIPCGK